jgi:hypothetical protein
MSSWEPWLRTDHRGLARYVNRAAGRFVELGIDRYAASLRRGGRKIIAAAAFEALKRQHILYDTELYMESPIHQVIRSPVEILVTRNKRGTCLDLATLFAALCLDNNLIPILIVLDNHALVGISSTHYLPEWNSPERPCRLAFDQPVTDCALLQTLIHSEALSVVECTGFARSEVLAVPHAGLPETMHRSIEGMSFERALAAGAEQLLSSRELDFAIDITVAHNLWNFTPFPFETPSIAFIPTRPSPTLTFAVPPVSGVSRRQNRSRNRKLRTKHINLYRPSWPIRDQGQRGTSAAFAAVALAEYKLGNERGEIKVLAPEFLYWAIKTSTGDPRPDQDGTLLRFARDALEEWGVCDENLCPYNKTLDSGRIFSEPTDEAKAAARPNAFTGTIYQRSPDIDARAVLEVLRQNRPVAISIPLFRDLYIDTGVTNWTTLVAWLYGRIFNPPPLTSVITGEFVAVCIVGFVPDPDEEMGGYFIFRNSWGADWSRQSPTQAYHAPEPGYGEISASYVDLHTAEMLALI